MWHTQKFKKTMKNNNINTKSFSRKSQSRYLWNKKKIDDDQNEQRLEIQSTKKNVFRWRRKNVIKNTNKKEKNEIKMFEETDSQKKKTKMSHANYENCLNGHFHFFFILSFILSFALSENLFKFVFYQSFSFFLLWVFSVFFCVRFTWFSIIKHFAAQQTTDDN